MAKNRYNVYYTFTTQKMISALEKEGHAQRDVINAGIVLFFKADDSERGAAYMTANVKPGERLKTAVDDVKKNAYTVQFELLSDDDKELVSFIRSKYGPDAEQHARQAISDHDDATSASHTEPLGKEARTDAKAG